MTRAADPQALRLPTEIEDRPSEPGPGQRAEQLAARIKDDARERSEEYLRETVVPEGGE